MLALLLQACGSSDDYSPYGGTKDPVGVKIGKPYKVNGTRYYPKPDPYYDETGVASWYGPGFDGRQTASGEEFDQYEMTAAHKTLPMPSIVKVTHQRTGKTIQVRINDRGPFAHGRIIDLSKAAAQELGMIGEGTAKVRVQYLPLETERFYADMGLTMPAAMRTAAQEERQYAKVEKWENAPMPNPVIPAQNKAPTPLPQDYYNQSASISSIQADELPPLGDVEPTLPQEYQQDAFSVIDSSTSYRAAMPMNSYFVQVASFGLRENAERLANKLSTYATTDIKYSDIGGKDLYRVRLGPVGKPAIADDILMRVVSLGYRDAHIVSQ